MNSSLMFRRPFSAGLMLAATLLVSIPVTADSTAATPARRPNVIFILTDDLGYGDVGVFFQNQRQAQGQPCELTPNLDAMAAQGIQLRDHYTSAPVCAPARATLLAGVTQGHAGVRNNQFDKALDNNHTLGTVMKGAGYVTAAIGKWGLQGVKESPETEEGGPQNPTDDPTSWAAFPTKRGFDYYFGYIRHKDGHEHYPHEGLHEGKKQVWDMDRNISPDLAGCYTADLFTARAKKWITDQHASAPDKPFFLYLAYDTPHAALELPPMEYPKGGGLHGGIQWLGQPGGMINTATGTPDSYCYPEFANATYTGRAFGPNAKKNAGAETRPWPEVCKRYASDVHRIDDCVGDLLQLLRDLKIDDNTLVIFTSDNGPSDESYLKGGPMFPTFFRSMGPFDGIKRDCWEGGVRESAIARWPGTIPAGRVNETPSQFQDWMPTLADVAGLPAPARTDGVSLVPTLTGRSGQQPSLIYSEYFHNGKTPVYPDFAPSHRGRPRGQMQLLRLGDFVGVRYNVKSQADDFEIYDVIHDPQELTNLAAQKPELEQRMKDTVLQVRRPDPAAPRPYDHELVPPDAEKAMRDGVAWREYETTSPWLPKLDFLTPASSGISPTIDVSSLPAKSGTATLYTGYLQVPADGNYTLSLAANGKALLRIHDATVIDEDFGYTGGVRSGDIQLKAGPHAFRLYYLPGDGPRRLDLQWSVNGTPPAPIPAAVFRHTGA